MLLTTPYKEYIHIFYRLDLDQKTGLVIFCIINNKSPGVGLAQVVYLWTAEALIGSKQIIRSVLAGDNGAGCSG